MVLSLPYPSDSVKGFQVGDTRSLEFGVRRLRVKSLTGVESVNGPYTVSETEEGSGRRGRSHQ